MEKKLKINKKCAGIMKEIKSYKYSKEDLEIRMGERDFGVHNSAKVHPDVKIGKNVTIGPNCTIGYDGFNYDRNKETGEATLKKHKGTVIIHDNVEIHGNVCIDRGLYGDTIIGKGVKIDNLVHVAHDVVIGENTLVVAGTVIGGEVKIGTDNFIGINVSIKPKITIGMGNLIGMGAVVLSNIGEFQVIVGSPARSIRDNYGWWKE
jgi:UDP-3-O-[3-hydroxymyristoyl] glucosamine N-acyltransferase